MAAISQTLLFTAYVGGFGLAGVACFVAARATLRIDDPDTRRGLFWTLLVSGGWSLSHIGSIVAPTPALKEASYLLGLIVGLATVGTWLYFCSAYTGRTYHHDPWLRRIAVAIYLLITGVKLTNPLHNAYFSGEVVSDPFTHFAVQQQPFHWAATGLSYALAAIGLFMLFELFREADYETWPISALTALTALPVVLDLVGFASDLLLDMIYAPLGVAAFAVGVLFVHDERFLAVQLTGGVDEPLVFLDDDGQIRDYNRRAESLFPALDDARGEPLIDVLPVSPRVVTGRADDGSADDVVPITEGEETRYYLVSASEFPLGGTRVGRALLFFDVTDTERQRRELNRQNDQLEDFADAITHELRNTLTIVDGYVDAAGAAVADGDIDRAQNALSTAAESASRMERIVDDLSDLAEYGQTVDRTRPTSLRRSVERALADVNAGDASLALELNSDRGDGDVAVRAAPGRLQALFENAFEFARSNGAEAVTVTVGEEGFSITDDGDPPVVDDVDQFFEYGEAVPTAEAGISLPNVKTMAQVHGWGVRVDTEYSDGVRIVVNGVRLGAETSLAEPA